MIFEPLPCCCKEIVEHMAHRQNGRACINRPCGAVDSSDFAAQMAMAFKQVHFHSCRRQPDRAGKPAHAAADDGCAV